ncbi:hypothetical protein LIER_24194 [Lithospermum erythrorhizon]|uniref:Pentatricopeptide repeat-containing protein n=1 Tax=Lithospermum erythrorhizon TaxID=34254 RepID=A0AAV3R3Y3_LITER
MQLLKTKTQLCLLSLCRHLRNLTTGVVTTTVKHLTPPHPHPGPSRSIIPVNQSHLIRVCTILYQQHNSSDQKLKNNLSNVDFDLTHEFFLQVCNRFPYSWKPVYKFHIFTQSQEPIFHHTSTTYNKMLDVVGKSRNIDLVWELTQEAGKLQLVNMKTFIIALKTLASARELKKCVEFFHIMNGFGHELSLETLNTVVEALCKSKLVSEANHVVVKLKDVIRPNGITYKWLVYGFCDVGDVIEASKIWNLMVDEGFEPKIDVVEILMESLFKNNCYGEAVKLLQSMRLKRMDNLRLSSYSLVIKWLCKKGKLGESRVLLDEMQSRGIEADSATLASIVYGLISRGRVNEAYKTVEGIESPDISVYHGMIKGLLKLKKASEATKVFREMIKRGCEPTMHTYIMLLQGHLGRRGRKGEDPLVNFDTIFIGGLIKAGKSLEATKYVERVVNRGQEVPRFDYNKFLHYFSNEEGVVMFEVMAKKLREVGSFDVADIFERYGEKMATRDRRRMRVVKE